MATTAKTVLYIRLPCWKIYPGGVIYVADYIHKRRPGIDQHLIDLAIVPPAERKRTIAEALERLKPEVVAFSWRNMQSFGPHPEDDALDVVMNFEYAPNPWTRLKSAFGAARIIYDYTSGRLKNFGYMKLVRRMLPQSRIVVGGTAVTIFGKYVAEKCPTDSVVVIGEGEDAMLSVVDGFETPAGELYYKGRDGKVTHRPRTEMFDLARLTAVDLPYVETLFPRFGEYLDTDIGVHTKRGCPFQCHFCLYNKIEGARQRYRDPAEVAKEIEALSQRWGIKRIWFTDAQFCSTRKSTEHVEQILDEMLARRTKVSWSGYIRLNYMTPAIARKMLASGMTSLDLSFTGSQEVIDKLTLGYSLTQQMDAFRMFKENGHTDQKVKLYMPLNAPGETTATLQATIDRVNDVYDIFGRDHVLPFIFFIGVQPGTPVEALLIKTGYLKAGYNPLTFNPFIIKRLLYNPKPLGGLIGRAYLKALAALDPASEYIGRATMDLIAHELATDKRWKKPGKAAAATEIRQSA